MIRIWHLMFPNYEERMCILEMMCQSWLLLWEDNPSAMWDLLD